MNKEKPRIGAGEERKTNDRRSLAMFIASMLIFGTIGIFRRSIPLPSAFLAFFRGISGGLFLLLFSRLRRRGASRRIPRRELLLLAVTGAMIGFNWMLLFEAYNHTSVAVATLCYYMQPTIVILLSPAVFRERLTGRKLACALISSHKYLEEIDPLALTALMAGCSAALALIGSFIFEGGIQLAHTTGRAWLIIVYLAIACTLGGYMMQNLALTKISERSVALLQSLCPVMTAIFSFLILGEKLSAAGVLGAIIIISCVSAATAFDGQLPTEDVVE